MALSWAADRSFSKFTAKKASLAQERLSHQDKIGNTEIGGSHRLGPWRKDGEAVNIWQHLRLNWRLGRSFKVKRAKKKTLRATAAACLSLVEARQVYQRSTTCFVSMISALEFASLPPFAVTADSNVNQCTASTGLRPIRVSTGLMDGVLFWQYECGIGSIHNRMNPSSTRKLPRVLALQPIPGTFQGNPPRERPIATSMLTNSQESRSADNTSCAHITRPRQHTILRPQERFIRAHTAPSSATPASQS
ncbi:hypothetical protein C8R47DRAFT_1235161 [Mycena vitilis]|nr:hypothetical protein C8R47DRAFT_1235161 [Mycena vitilis]